METLATKKPPVMTKLRGRIRNRMEEAILEHEMIDDGDRVLVGVSGGRDSFALLDLLGGPLVKVEARFSILAVHVDLGFEEDDPGRRAEVERYLAGTGVDYQIETTDFGRRAHGPENRKNPCFLCSRRRRRRLYEIAHARGCTKIALGHHKDDVVETLLLNIFFGREISTMMANQEVFRGRFHIIRPFATLEEKTIKLYAREAGLPAFDQPCPTGDTTKRKVIKDLLASISKDHPYVKENIFKSLRHVRPEFLWSVHEETGRAGPSPEEA